jgi:hypothetical protein
VRNAHGCTCASASKDLSAIGFDDHGGSDFSGLAGELETALAKLLLFEHGLPFRGIKIAAAEQCLAVATSEFPLECPDKLLGSCVGRLNRIGRPGSTKDQADTHDRTRERATRSTGARHAATKRGSHLRQEFRVDAFCVGHRENDALCTE